MGMDIHVKLYKYDEDRNQFKKVTLYRWNEKKGEYQEVYIFPGRNSEMFDGMKNGDENDGYGYFPTSPIRLNSFFDPDREELEKTMNTQGYFDFWEINLAEFALYCRNHPKVVNYDIEWDEEQEGKFIKPTKENPICNLFKEICSYGAFADEWEWGFNPLSLYKVVIYFDW